jgi:hypothetical protein
MWRQIALLVALVTAGCADASKAPPAAEPAAGPPAAPLAVAAAASCTERARLALAGNDAERLGLVLDAAVPGAVDNDLGLPRAVGETAAPCVLRVAAPRPLPTAGAVVLAREPVTGRYADGARTQPNPEHERLRHALRTAERARGGTVDLYRTGEPMADLVGGLVELGVAGVELLTREGRLAQLRAALAATPETLTVPRERTYRYEILTVEARRAAELRVTLVDRRGGAPRAATSRVEETRRLRVAEGRRADDLAAAPGDLLDGLAAVEAWRRRGPPLLASAALAHLLEVGSATTAADPSVPPEPAAGATRWPGLLTLRGAAGATLAVRIAAGQLVADARALGPSDVAELVDAAGRRSLALVRARSADGLALLATSLDGPPAELGEAVAGPARLIGPGRAGRPAIRDGQLVVDLDGGLLWSGDPGDGVIVVGDKVVALQRAAGGPIAPLRGPAAAVLSAGGAMLPARAPASPR